jgi:RNA polymerase sigma-70 factor (ECF subfamily)
MHRIKARTRRSLASFESLLAPLREQTDPAVRAEADDLRQRARHAVGDVLSLLNPRYRRAIELRFFEEQPRERCAELMQVKLGTFDVLLLRALRSFRKQWELSLGAQGVTLPQGSAR